MMTHSSPQTKDPHDSNSQTSLKRGLGYRQMTMLALGSALGTGLFLGTVTPISIAGPAVIIVFIIAAVIIGIIASCLGELASRYPLPGGFGTLTAKFLGPYAGFTTRWMYWGAAVIAIGSEVTASSVYISWWFPHVPLWASATTVALLLGLINYFSVHSFGTIEYLLSSIKVIALVVFIAIGLLLIIFGFPPEPAVGVGNWFNDGGFIPNGPESLWIALPFVLFSFIGIELVSISAGEAKEPRRSIRSAMKQLIWRLGFFYIIAISIVVAVVPWKDIAQSDESVAESPFVKVFSYLGQAPAATITNFVVLVAAISSANATLYGASRLIHSLAVDHMAPTVFARTSSKKVPIAGLTVSLSGVVLAIILLVAGINDVYVYFITTALFGILTVWCFILVAFIKYKVTTPAEEMTQKNIVSNPSTLSQSTDDIVDTSIPYFQFMGGHKVLSISGASLALLAVISAACVGFVNEFMTMAMVGGLSFLTLVTVLYFYFRHKNIARPARNS